MGSGHRLCVNKAYGQGPTTPSLGSSLILSKACSQRESTSTPNTNGDQDGPPLSKLGSRSMRSKPTPVAEGEPRPTSKPPARVMTKLILVMVWRKLVRNPNTYSGLIGLAWSLISFKYVKVIASCNRNALFEARYTHLHWFSFKH